MDYPTFLACKTGFVADRHEALAHSADLAPVYRRRSPSADSISSETEHTMTDDAHDAACGCFNFGSSYAPLTMETDPSAKRVITVRQGPEPLALTFSDTSFTVISTKSDGTGLLDVGNSCLSY